MKSLIALFLLTQSGLCFPGSPVAAAAPPEQTCAPLSAGTVTAKDSLVHVCCAQVTGGAAGLPDATGTDCSAAGDISATEGTCTDPDRPFGVCCLVGVGTLPAAGASYAGCGIPKNA